MNVSNGSGYDTAAYVCQRATQPVFIVYVLFLLLIMVAALFSNVLVVVAVLMFKRLRRMSNYFIVSLAVSDLLVAAASLPIRIAIAINNNNFCLDYSTCIFFVSMDGVYTSASICQLAVISFDRYLAITKPFTYSKIMTKKRGLCLLAFVWVYSCLWGLLSLINWTDESPAILYKVYAEYTVCKKVDPVYYTTAMSVAFFLPLVIVVTTYSCVLKEAVKQARSLALPDSKKRSRKRIVRELKVTKVIAMVISAFIICWLPFFVIVVMSLWCSADDCFSAFQKYPALSLAIHIPFLYVLPYLNSAVNPLIYAVYNKEFRKAFRIILKCRRKIRVPEGASATEHSNLNSRYFRDSSLDRCSTDSNKDGDVEGIEMRTKNALAPLAQQECEADAML